MAQAPRLIFLLNSAQRRLAQWVAAEQALAARDGLDVPTPAQAGLLFVLAQEDGATMGRLAEVLDLAPSAVSGLVQRSEVLQWVQRQASALDGRAQQVWLLPAGQAWLAPLRHTARRINTQLSAGFSDAELLTVARWLRHVQQLGDPTPASSPP